MPGRQVPPKRILKRAGHSFRGDIAKQIDTEGFCPIRGETHAGTGRWRGNDGAQPLLCATPSCRWPLRQNARHFGEWSCWT